MSDDEVKFIKPIPDQSGAAETCSGCVIAVEIYISVVKGTIVASRPPSSTAAEALESLCASQWSNTVDLDRLALEIDDGRSLKMYNPLEWVHPGAS